MHDQLCRIGAEALSHLTDPVCHDAELGAFPSGMHKSDRRRFWIYDVNGTTISDISTESDTGLIGDDAIAAGKFAAW